MNQKISYLNGLKVMSKIHISIQLYLFITEFFFFFGPWDWQVADKLTLMLFLAGIHISIFFSYLFARTKVARDVTTGMVYSQTISNDKFIKLCIFLTLMMTVPTSLSRTGSPIPDIFQGLSNLGSAYNENFERLSEGNDFYFVEYIRIFMSPFLVGMISIWIFYWNDMKFNWKLVNTFCVIFSTAIYISIGTNKGIADLIILAPLFAHLYMSTKNEKHSFIFHRINAIGLIIFILFLIFFGQTQELRQGNVGVAGVHYTGAYIIYADPYALPDWVDRQWLIIYQSITRYLTSGYQALAFALQIDNPPTYGVGNSMFLTQNVDRIFASTYFSNNNLPAVLETQTGWSRFYLWHTAYVWFMSDFGFLGTIFLIGVFGYILFINLFRTIVYKNVISVVITQQMIVLFLYLPANNQVFQNGEGLFGTIFILIISLFFNKSEMLKRGVF